jgi:hypothetical protein
LKCPKCGIRAAKHAISCFCGYEFVKSDAPVIDTEPETKPDTELEHETAVSDVQPGAEPAAEELPTTEPGSKEPSAEVYEAEAAPAAPESAPRPEAHADNGIERYDRVGGWLLLLCVSLTILGPLATVYNLVAGYGQLEGLFEATALGLFSLWAGFSLWTRMDGAVERAKKYLYAILGYSVVLYFLPTMSGLPEEMSTEMQSVMAIASVRSIIYVAIWYLYLTKSKRVRGTYRS